MIQNAFDLPQRILVFIYIFYNICIYGFFMGFPVFNMVTGIVAGCYCGKKVVYEKVEANQIMHIGKKISSFTAFIVLLFCILSGIIAIIDGSIGGELEHMLGLGFKVTEGMVLSLILIGGLALIICQYYLTKMVFLKTTTFYLKKEYV
ncbi:hypothetical protein JW935_05370 [candidate division KSB1 bacterium]|nr:hypothetical protein [candidate division KSB1 bacterium]